MASRERDDPAAVGVFDHWGWAILVTVAGDGRLVDRRRVELVDADLPKFPHHHDAQGLSVPDAMALVLRVTRSAEVCAKACLAALASSVPVRIATIALRACPPLPPTIAERLSNYRAQNVADSVMYREALARAAAARGWSVHWYDTRRVLSGAASALADEAGAAIGRPWTKDHKLAMAAAISAACNRR